jgi:hypothetical protein
VNRLLLATVFVPTLAGACLTAEEPLSPTSKPAAAPLPGAVITEVQATVTTDAWGVAWADLDIPDGQDALQFEATNVGSATMVRVAGLFDPAGALQFDPDAGSADEIGLDFYARFATPTTIALPYPFRAQDPVAGGRWSFAVELVDEYGEPVEEVDVAIEFTVTAKRVVDAQRQAVKVHVVYVDGIDEDEALRPAVEQALLRMQERFPAALGTTVAVRTSTAAVELGASAIGNAALAELSTAAEPGEITMLVGADLPDTLLGEVGNIPGILRPGPDAGIVIAAQSIAGSDGVFADDEVTKLALVMTHELGHHLGLHHIVQADGTPDALADTPECPENGSCDFALGSYLMYPFAITNEAFTTTEAQRTVVQQDVRVR